MPYNTTSCSIICLQAAAHMFTVTAHLVRMFGTGAQFGPPPGVGCCWERALVLGSSGGERRQRQPPYLSRFTCAASQLLAPERHRQGAPVTTFELQTRFERPVRPGQSLQPRPGRFFRLPPRRPAASRRVCPGSRTATRLLHTCCARTSRVRGWAYSFQTQLWTAVLLLATHHPSQP